MGIIGKPKLLRSFACDAEDKLLSLVKSFAQLKVLEGHTSWNRSTDTEVPEASANPNRVEQTYGFWATILPSFKKYRRVP